MSFSDLPHDAIVLVKQDGRRIATRAIVTKGQMRVFDAKLPADTGDQVERAIPNGTKELWDVLDAVFESGLPPHIPASFVLKVRNTASRPTQHAAPAVVNQYVNSGQVGAMGPGAQANNTTITVQQHVEFSAADRAKVAEELAALRAALAAGMRDAEDAIEIGRVGEAEVAAKGRDASVLLGALRRFGARAWQTAERLGLEFLASKAGVHLGLPNGERE